MKGSNMSHRIKILSVAAVIVGLLLSTTTSSTHDYINSRFALAQFDAYGLIDRTFGSNGRLTTDFPSSLGEEANAIAITFGKIVVAGSAHVADTGHQFALARYNANGSLDTTFDGDGMVLTNFASSTDEEANALATDASGKTVVAGFAVVGGGGQFALARYNANGSLDTTFDGDGKVLTDFASGRYEAARALAIDGNGKIVVAGWCDVGSTGGDGQFALARYNANGSLDWNFGDHGKVLTRLSDPYLGSGSGYAYAIANYPGASYYVAAGCARFGSERLFALARYRYDGSLDWEFAWEPSSADGVGFTRFGGFLNAGAYALAIGHDYRYENIKIVAAGFAGDDPILH